MVANMKQPRRRGRPPCIYEGKTERVPIVLTPVAKTCLDALMQRHHLSRLDAAEHLIRLGAGAEVEPLPPV